MNRVTIPGTDLTVSRLSFGTASLHHLPSTRQIQVLLDAAAETGITHFDTSPYYGFGLAELQLGRFLKRRKLTISIATKVGIYPPLVAGHSLTAWLSKSLGKVWPPISRPEIDFSVARADASLNASLKRLGRDYVDILFLHEPRRELLSCDELLAWKERVAADGKVRHFGLAGPAQAFLDWHDFEQCSEVLQARDSIEGREADCILKSGRKLQFTYGYFSSMATKQSNVTAQAIIVQAMARNSEGSILISTRRRHHLAQLTSISETVTKG